MNRDTVVVLLFSTLVILVGAAVYGDGSCGTCHVIASGGGPRNSNVTLFENQPGA